MLKLLTYPKIKNMFEKACKKLGIFDRINEIKEMVIYEMTDGTRTSTSQQGWEVYFDGGLFCLRLIHCLKNLGVKHLYINVIHERHKFRNNYRDIYLGLKELVSVYRNYAEKEKDVRWLFIGDYEKSLEPRGLEEYNLGRTLKELEKLTENYSGINVYFMLNYSAKKIINWDIWKKLPQANVIVRHCKGYVNGDMWLYDKLDNNSFVYVQNGSVNKNWSDEDLIYLISIAFRSMLVNKGTHYSKVYHGKEMEEIRKKREEELSIVHKKLSEKISKRMIIFSPYGPEIYEF